MKKLRIAIQGIRGSYSEEAASQMVSGPVDMVECRSFEGVFRALRGGQADRAVVPVRNRINGEIKPVMHLLAGSNMPVAARLRLPISHVLAGKQEAELGAVTAVRSHPEALKQCRGFLEKSLPALRTNRRAISDPLTLQPSADTATAIREVMQAGGDTTSVAAICSQRAAELYGAKVLTHDIADESENWTEFYLIC